MLVNYSEKYRFFDKFWVYLVIYVFGKGGFGIKRYRIFCFFFEFVMRIICLGDIKSWFWKYWSCFFLRIIVVCILEFSEKSLEEVWGEGVGYLLIG